MDSTKLHGGRPSLPRHPDRVRCHITGDVEVYAAAVSPLLERDPVVNNVALSVIEEARAGRYADALYAWVEDGGEVVGAASHTPPYRLLLPAMPATAVDAVCERLLHVGHELPGVTGPVELTARFADGWSRATGVQVRVGMAQRLYRLGELTPPTGVPGELVPAVPADLSLAADWITGFAADVGSDHFEDPLLDARHRVQEGQLYLWRVDGRPVSMAGTRYPVAGAARVSLVYTPAEERRRGYAAACVAALSRRLLDGGYRDCLLYTDLANPVSNSVYQRIGYRPVLDAQELLFGGGGAEETAR